jgi:PAS domain S-box-containing protein
LRGVVAQPNITPVSSAKTRPNTSGDVSGLSRDAIEALPAAVYMTDAEGRLTFYNEAAAVLWGCRPELGEAKFCGSWKLYWPDGTPLPHDQCPMAMALHQRRPIRRMEAVAERPDGTRIPFIPYPTPLFDESGRLTGAINLLVDISERKRAEAALEERNALVELASRVGQIGTYSYNYRTRILHLSPGCAAIYGLPEDLCEITQEDWRALVHPDDLPRIDTISRQALAQRQPEFVLEFRIIRPDGKDRWIEARLLISYDDAGRAVQMIGANIDVTARKQTAQDLAERSVQLALAEKVARVGSFVNDTQTDTIQFSAGYAAIHGFPAETKILRSQWRANVHPEDVERMDELREQVFRQRQGEYNVDYRTNLPGSGVRWIESRAFVSYDGNGRQRVVGVNIDVTERKMAELALAERNIQLALAAKVGLVGSYAYDAETEIMQISDGYAAIHGFPEGTTEIARCECLAGVHPDDIGRVEQCRSEAFRQRRREYNVEYRIIRPGGELRWVETRCFISFSGAGRPHRVVGVSIDITERKRVEEHQRTLLAELDHRVKNALATVSAVVSHTRQGSRSVADFVAALDGRIRSMATTHELLSSHQWHRVSLTELVRRELAPYATRNNTEIDGPEVTLSARAGQAVSTVLHELATNAAKHGAFSVNEGRVSVRWHSMLNGSADGRIGIEWQETGGPAFRASDTSGYGMEVIRDLIPYELGGGVELTFPADGLCCRLEIPAEGAAYPETTMTMTPCP